MSLEKLEKVKRLEVIDDEGVRRYACWDCSVSASLQDDGRTLKLFVDKIKK